MTLKTVARQFCLVLVIAFITKVRNQTFRNGKRYEGKTQCLLFPCKEWGNFFVKKLCMGEQTFWGQIFGGCFTWQLMIGSCKLMVRRFQRSSLVKLVYLSHTLTWVIYVLFEKNTLHTMPLGLGTSCKACLIKKEWW